MYNDLIRQFKQAQVTAAAAYGAVANAETQAFPHLEDYQHAVRLRQKYTTKRELCDFCNRLADVAVYETQRLFSPANGSIAIDQATCLQEVGVNIEEALDKNEIPDLDAFRAYLERTYSGEAGMRIAYAQAAKTIIDGFWLKPTTEIKRTSSGIVIEVSVYSEKSIRRNGIRRLSWNSDSRTASLLNGLSTFAQQAGFANLSRELVSRNLANDDYASRDKVTLSGLEIVRYNEKWVFRFAHAIGDALSLFISEFGSSYLASRDR